MSDLPDNKTQACQQVILLAFAVTVTCLKKNHSPLQGDSWLNRIPLTANSSCAALELAVIQKENTLAAA